MARRTPVLLLAVVGLVAAACAAPPPPVLPPAPAGPALRVMTFNLLGAQGDDAVYSEHAGWAARVDQLQPDVLVVQEAQSEDVSALLSRTTTDYQLAAYELWWCDTKNNPEGVAVLVRGDVPLGGGGGTNLGGSCQDPTLSRVLVWADVTYAGQPYRVYGTHLTAGGGTAALSRARQIDLVRERIAVDDPAATRRWLLAGDLNFVPGSGDYQRMLEGLPGSTGPGTMVDTFAELHPGAASPSTCPQYPSSDTTAQTYLLANPEVVRACGYTAGWAKDENLLQCEVLSLCTSWETRQGTSVRNRIDIVLAPAGGPLEVTRTFVPNRADADWASPGAEWFRLADHLPYVVDLAPTE
ncbi:MAG: endonuclease/exonuclease/phosphatase family protein [Actinomycetes bacterium]